MTVKAILDPDLPHLYTPTKSLPFNVIMTRSGKVPITRTSGGRLLVLFGFYVGMPLTLKSMFNISFIVKKCIFKVAYLEKSVADIDTKICDTLVLTSIT